MFQLTGHGSFGHAVRTTSLAMEVCIPEGVSTIFANAIYARESLDLKGARIVGDVRSAGGLSGDHNVSGGVASDQPFHFADPTFPIKDSLPLRSPIRLSGNPSSAYIGDDGYYSEINIGNGTLTIDTGGKDERRVLLVDELDSNPQGQIQIRGEGTVLLFLNESSTLAGTITTESGSSSENGKLIIFLKAGITLTLQTPSETSGDPTFAYIYGPSAAVHMQAGPALRGSVVANNLGSQGGGNEPFEIVYEPFPGLDGLGIDEFIDVSGDFAETVIARLNWR